jgi:hypothetical protein
LGFVNGNVGFFLFRHRLGRGLLGLEEVTKVIPKASNFLISASNLTDN